MSAPLGKYVSVDPDNPRALAICDYSGLPCMYDDLVKQMAWRGESLVWTGLMVNKRFADKPNEQGRSPILPPDPVPVPMARPQFFQSMTWSNNPLPVWSLCSYPWAALSNITSGALAPPNSQIVEQNSNYYWGSWGA